MAVTKKNSNWRDWVPAFAFGAFFVSLVAFPYVRDKFFPTSPTHVVEWKDKIVEKEVVKEVAPTVSINSLRIVVEEVIDGSTLRGTVELPLGIHLVDQTIRCVGYETYVLTELKGLDAKNELALLVTDSECFGMTSTEARDSDGNILLTVYVRKQDQVISVGKRLEEKGFTKTSPEVE